MACCRLMECRVAQETRKRLKAAALVALWSREPGRPA